MWAVIETGGKQYLVKEDDRLEIEKKEGERGDRIKLDKVLLIGGETLMIGRPYIEGAYVEVEVEKQGRGKKLVVYKKKRRKGYEVRKGHRQYLTTMKVVSINQP
jgi:large subunit ribosomal protein L21